MNRMISGTPTAGPYNGLGFVWAYDPPDFVATLAGGVATGPLYSYR